MFYLNYTQENIESLYPKAVELYEASKLEGSLVGLLSAGIQDDLISHDDIRSLLTKELAIDKKDELAEIVSMSGQFLELLIVLGVFNDQSFIGSCHGFKNDLAINERRAKRALIELMIEDFANKILDGNLTLK